MSHANPHILGRADGAMSLACVMGVLARVVVVVVVVIGVVVVSGILPAVDSKWGHKLAERRSTLTFLVINLGENTGSASVANE